MFKVNHKNIKMAEGDFGITLPMTIVLESGEELTNSDSFSIKIYAETNGEELISKTYTADEEQTINFELTEQESTLLPVGSYKYDIDWYCDGEFRSNLIADSVFSVYEKAGGLDED